MQGVTLKRAALANPATTPNHPRVDAIVKPLERDAAMTIADMQWQIDNDRHMDVIKRVINHDLTLVCLMIEACVIRAGCNIDAAAAKELANVRTLN